MHIQTYLLFSLKDLSVFSVSVFFLSIFSLVVFVHYHFILVQLINTHLLLWFESVSFEQGRALGMF